MRLFLVSGYGGLWIRKRRLGELWSRPSMWRVLIGFQPSLTVLVVLVFGSSLIEVGKIFPSHNFQGGWWLLHLFFLHHKWGGGFLLRDRFPSLYALANDRDTHVSDYLEHNSSSLVCSHVFVCDAFLEDDSVAQFFNLLDRVRFNDSSVDMVRWNLNAIGRFTVKSYFLHLSSPVGNTSSSYVCGFLWNIIWKSAAPFFCSSCGKILMARS